MYSGSVNRRVQLKPRLHDFEESMDGRFKKHPHWFDAGNFLWQRARSQKRREISSRSILEQFNKETTLLPPQSRPWQQNDRLRLLRSAFLSYCRRRKVELVRC